MKLELKHLSAYLPYGNKIQISREDGSIDVIDLNVYKISLILDGYYCHSEKLILRPLSDLTKEITHNGKTFVPFDELKSYSFELNKHKKWSKVVFEDMAYSEVQKLHEWHFDTFGLIEKGLAISCNDL